MARTMTPEDIQTLVTRLRSSVDARMRRSLKRSVGHRQAQIDALKREEELVAGRESPKGRKLQLRLAGIERQAQLARVQERTADLGAKLRKGEATVTGRVTDVRGRPRAGVRVALAGKEDPNATPVKPVTTDENGFYAVRVPRCRLEKLLKQSKTLELALTGGPTNLELTVKRPAGERAISRRVFDVRVTKKRGRGGDSR